MIFGITCVRDGFLGTERGAALSALSCLLRAGANRARGIGDDKGAGGGEEVWERGSWALQVGFAGRTADTAVKLIT